MKKVLLEWKLQFDKVKNNCDLMIAAFTRLQLIQCLLSFLTYLSNVDSQIQPKDVLIYSRVSNAADSIIKKKFILTTDHMNSAKELASKVDNEYNINALKQMIVSAMGLSAGHFFKCPNGHYYAIGECGGAMEEGKCPECGKKFNCPANLGKL